MDLDGAVVLYRRANALADVSDAGGTGELLVICDLLVDVRLHDGTLIHADMFRPGPARSGQTAPPRAAR